MTPDTERMGPVDIIVLEFPGLPTGGAVPHLIDLVDRGLIRITDLAVVRTSEDGAVVSLTVADLDLDGVPEFGVFEGASSGLLRQADVEGAVALMRPGSSAVVLMYENAWVTPFASAVSDAGGQLLASARIPFEAINAALDDLDATRADTP